MDIYNVLIDLVNEIAKKISFLKPRLLSLQRMIYAFLQKQMLSRRNFILNLKKEYAAELGEINYKTITPRKGINYSDYEKEFLKQVDTRLTFENNFDFSREVYSCEFRKVKYFGISGAIEIKKKILLDSMFGLRRFMDTYFGDFLFLKHQKKKGYYTSVLHLDWASSNIYHWLCDCLTRLYSLSDLKEKRIYFIINANIAPYQLETLKFFLDERFKLIRIKSYEVWELEKLYFPSFVQSGPGFFPKQYLDFVRDKILAGYEILPTSAKTRIYVSRNKTRRRRVLNEDDVVALMKKYKIQIIYPEDFSFKEQIQLFHSAELIISVHGAGFTNMIFSEHATIVEFIPPWNPIPPLIYNPAIFLLAKSLGFKYYYIIGNNKNENQDFFVDLSKLGEILKNL